MKGTFGEHLKKLSNEAYDNHLNEAVEEFKMECIKAAKVGEQRCFPRIITERGMKIKPEDLIAAVKKIEGIEIQDAEFKREFCMKDLVEFTAVWRNA